MDDVPRHVEAKFCGVDMVKADHGQDGYEHGQTEKAAGEGDLKGIQLHRELTPGDCHCRQRDKCTDHPKTGQERTLGVLGAHVGILVGGRA